MNDITALPLSASPSAIQPSLLVGVAFGKMEGLPKFHVMRRPVHDATQSVFRFTTESGHVRCNSDVRFGSKADMCAAIGHVRFTLESRHWRSQINVC
jgi:hypothetical protein